MQLKITGACDWNTFACSRFIVDLLQSDFQRVEDSLMAVRLDLQQVRERESYDKKKVASLSSEIVMHQSKNEHLTRDLEKAQNEVLSSLVLI